MEFILVDSHLRKTCFYFKFLCWTPLSSVLCPGKLPPCSYSRRPAPSATALFGQTPAIRSAIYTAYGSYLLTNTNTNTNNLFLPNPMRYNKMHNVNTILNNKAQLSVLVFFVKFHFGFSLWFAICSLLRIFMKLWWRIFFLHQMYGSWGDKNRLHSKIGNKR